MTGCETSATECKHPEDPHAGVHYPYRARLIPVSFRFRPSGGQTGPELYTVDVRD